MLSTREVDHLANDHWKNALEETTQKLSRKGSGHPMASFTVQINFLQVAFEQEQSVLVQRGALIAMNDSLDIASSVNGGLFQTFIRMWSTGDTFFHQQFVAASADVICYSHLRAQETFLE